MLLYCVSQLGRHSQHPITTHTRVAAVPAIPAAAPATTAATHTPPTLLLRRLRLLCLLLRPSLPVLCATPIVASPFPLPLLLPHPSLPSCLQPPDSCRIRHQSDLTAPDATSPLLVRPRLQSLHPLLLLLPLQRLSSPHLRRLLPLLLPNPLVGGRQARTCRVGVRQVGVWGQPGAVGDVAAPVLRCVCGGGVVEGVWEESGVVVWGVCGV